ncbi:MAG: hypothetical protein A2X64_09075 [Ignavibacteria bacterium GWF2_33_9]|nr:MAG: hypothetical protein A2X64_09075 [Ignavibacteria bacterium GWF2_33_9]
MKKFVKKYCEIICEVLSNKIALMLIITMYGAFITACNMCPTSPENSGGDTKNYIYSTIIPINSQIPIITKFSLFDFSFEQLENNGSIFSAPAKNGNYAFIRNDSDGGGKLLVMGNTNNNSSITIDKENKEFTFYSPIISSTGEEIVFLGGSNQLYLWVNNTEDNSSYIDKISNKVFDNCIPTFSKDGSKLAFLEKIDESQNELKIIDAKNPENVFFSMILKDMKFQDLQDVYLTFSSNANKLLFVNETDSTDLLTIVNIITLDVKNITISKEELGVKIAQISPDGKYAAFTANDGNIWIVSLDTSQPLFSKLTTVNSCNYFLYLEWNSEGNKILAQSYNCTDEVKDGSTLFVLDLDVKNDLFSLNSINLYCNNIQRAFWSN